MRSPSRMICAPPCATLALRWASLERPGSRRGSKCSSNIFPIWSFWSNRSSLSGGRFSAKALDLVTCFDVLHDLGDPVGAAAHIHRSLKPDGTWMLMERSLAMRRRTISDQSDASPMHFDHGLRTGVPFARGEHGARR